jgi:hypothetical protein
MNSSFIVPRHLPFSPPPAKQNFPELHGVVMKEQTGVAQRREAKTNARASCCLAPSHFGVAPITAAISRIDRLIWRTD